MSPFFDLTNGMWREEDRASNFSWSLKFFSMIIYDQKVENKKMDNHGVECSNWLLPSWRINIRNNVQYFYQVQTKYHGSKRGNLDYPSVIWVLNCRLGKEQAVNRKTIPNMNIIKIFFQPVKNKS